MIERWGAFVARKALAVLLVGVAVTFAAAAYGFGVFDHLSQGGFDDKNSESARELQAERDTFGNQNIDVVAIYTSKDLVASDPEFQADVEQIVAGLAPGTTTSVIPYYDAPADAGLVSKDGHSVQVLISLAGESQDDYLSNYDDLSPTLEAPESTGLQTDLAGAFAVYNDVNEITSEDLARAESISLPVVVLLALLIFGSLVAASMPALVGLHRDGRRPRAGPRDRAVHRGLGLLGQRDLAARHRPGHRLRPVRHQPLPRGARAAAGRRPGRVGDGDPQDHDDRRPHRAVLRPHRRRGAVEPADLPAGLPQEHGLRRRGRGAGRDGGRPHGAARDAEAARPPGRRRAAAVAPQAAGRRRRRARPVGRPGPRRDAPAVAGHRRHRRPRCC